MASFRDLNDFLRHFKAGDDNPITHTRIGNGKDIYGGKYSIPDEKLNLFYKLYHRDVFINKKKEYLTEVQLKNDHRPLLVDFDFRYNTDVTSRKHDKNHIEDIIMMYIDNINKIFKIIDTITVYVLEKDNVNCKEDVTKDGIHMVFGISCDTTTQKMIREYAKRDIMDVFDDLGLINDPDNILDDGITKGHTNWQLFGSQKPDNEPYRITYIYNCGFNEDCDIIMDEEDITEINNLEILSKISARNNLNPTFEMNEDIIEEYKQMKLAGEKKKMIKRKKVSKFTVEGFNFNVSEITNIDILEKLVDKMLTDLPIEERNIKETHEFVMSLPSKYYDEYEYWIKCGWALHNTHFKLFITWMYFSSNSDKFNFDDIPKYYEMWKDMKDDGLTERSIMYWAREENPIEYKRIREETIDYYIQLTEEKATEWDIANVLYQLYKDEYRCASLRKNMWYQFKSHRWREIDSGTTLRFNISKTLSRIYIKKSGEFMALAELSSESDQEKQESYRKRAAKYTEIGSNLKRTTFKQNIMKEAAEIFFQSDPDFMENLDIKRHLLCFNNGVWDFETKEFRDGRPDDYVTLTTGISYKKYNKNNEREVQIYNEINDFMYKLFPNDELRRYMWEHLASTLIGKNKSQTFNIYNGSGRNGKSKLVELMSLVLGDYKGVVPITLVTQKRNNIGSLSPEIAALKGIRYAVMQEPSKNDKINDGVMKELTGEDEIQGRGLYKDTVTFVPQFKLVVCTNTLFDIKSNDDGTWRRIRLCEFMSKFVKEPKPTEKSPYEFEIDQDIGNKFEEWKYVFMDMLVQIAVEKNGIVNDCELVMNASNEYRQGQDYLMEFIKEKVISSDDPTSRIKKTEVYSEFKSWFQENFGKNVPKGKELYDFLNKELGKCTPNGWKGYKIKYDVDQAATAILQTDEC
ncbi:MAG: hypothetical protein CMF62_00045 [Magnetococcales bacterium]|nr:hypothetical protein [Magnetococcales bacterium]|tara:strand:+ start:1994 stop:4738 length:2745 start_codon:yes stop_codon:yes gene_type:complete